METQTCRICGVEKPVGDFYFRKDLGKYRTDCKACHAVNTDAWSARNPEKRKAIALKYAKANYPKLRANKAKHRAVDPLKVRKWCIENPEKMKAIRANWKANNKDKILLDVRRRQCAKLQATPAWANLDAIADIYELAREFKDAGIAVEVDHVVPLRSKHVCGLHVEQNLRILLAKHNRTKSNRSWPDMP